MDFAVSIWYLSCHTGTSDTKYAPKSSQPGVSVLHFINDYWLLRPAARRGVWVALGTMYIWRLHWGGGRGLAKFWPKEGRLSDFGTDKGREGVQNPEKLEDVICTCPLTSFSPTLTESGSSDKRRRQWRHAKKFELWKCQISPPTVIQSQMHKRAEVGGGRKSIQ